MMDSKNNNNNNNNENDDDEISCSFLCKVIVIFKNNNFTVATLNYVQR